MARARHPRRIFTPCITLLFQALIVAGAMASFSDISHAKDNSPRFGFGVSDISSGNPPQISINWKTSEAATFSAHTGLRNGSTADFFEFGARFHRNLFVEENQDFYFFLGAGLATNSGQSGYKLEAGAGSEIFLTGLPNFGMSFMAGFSLSTVTATSLQSLVSFGLHYYF